MKDSTIVCLALIGAAMFAFVLWLAVVESLAKNGQCGTPLRVEACK